MKQQMNFRVDEALADALKRHADDEHRTITQVVELALMEYLHKRHTPMPGVSLPASLQTKRRTAK